MERVENMNYDEFLKLLRDHIDAGMVTQAELARQVGCTKQHLFTVIHQKDGKRASWKLQEKIISFLQGKPLKKETVDYAKTTNSFLSARPAATQFSSAQAVVRGIFDDCVDKMDQALQELDLLKGVTGALPVPVIVLNSDKVIIYCNPKYIEMYFDNLTGDFCHTSPKCPVECETCHVHLALSRGKRTILREKSNDGQEMDFIFVPVFQSGEIIATVGMGCPVGGFEQRWKS